MLFQFFVDIFLKMKKRLDFRSWDPDLPSNSVLYSEGHLILSSENMNGFTRFVTLNDKWCPGH